MTWSCSFGPLMELSCSSEGAKLTKKAYDNDDLHDELHTYEDFLKNQTNFDCTIAYNHY